jgi:hypothetical protein
MRIATVSWLLPAILATCGWTQEVAFNVQVGHNFPAVGVVPGQTIRITTLNTVRNPAPAGIAVAPCRVTVRIYDGSGQIVKEDILDNLAPGTAKWVDYSPQISILVYPPPRFVVAAVVQVSATTPFSGVEDTAGALRIASCSVIPILEVFDVSTNRTTFAMPGPALNAPVQPVPRLLRPDREGMREQ